MSDPSTPPMGSGRRNPKRVAREVVVTHLRIQGHRLFFTCDGLERSVLLGSVGEVVTMQPAHSGQHQQRGDGPLLNGSSVRHWIETSLPYGQRVASIPSVIESHEVSKGAVANFFF